MAESQFSLHGFIRHMTPWDGEKGQRWCRTAVPGDVACSSPVRAARSQEVLVGVKLYHVYRPRVTREIGHHLASSQVPELEARQVAVRDN